MRKTNGRRKSEEEKKKELRFVSKVNVESFVLLPLSLSSCLNCSRLCSWSLIQSRVTHSLNRDSLLLHCNSVRLKRLESKTFPCSVSLSLSLSVSFFLFLFLFLFLLLSLSLSQVITILIILSFPPLSFDDTTETHTH